jgi:hypothetical protein
MIEGKPMRVGARSVPVYEATEVQRIVAKVDDR